jgi:hypothetical protein
MHVGGIVYHMYDRSLPKSSTWHVLSRALRSRENHAAVMINECIYLIGGSAVAGSILNLVECYDTKAPLFSIGSAEWKSCPPLQRRRQYHQAIVIDEHTEYPTIIVSGGQGDIGPLPFIEKWTPGRDNEWTELPLYHLPTELTQHSMCIVDHQYIVVLAGMNASNLVNNVHVLDGQNNLLNHTPTSSGNNSSVSAKWLSLPSLPVDPGLRGASVVVV